MKFDPAELATLPARRYCHACGTEKDCSEFGKNKCKECEAESFPLRESDLFDEPGASKGSVARKRAVDRKMQELMAKFSSVAGEDGLKAESLNALTCALSGEMGGPKSFAKHFQNFFLTVMERYIGRSDAEGNALAMKGQGARTVLDVMRTYIKLIKDNEANRRDIEDLNHMSDGDLRKMLATSLLSDLPDSEADDLLRILAEARGKAVIEVVESESEYVNQCVTAD